MEIGTARKKSFHFCGNKDFDFKHRRLRFYVEFVFYGL